MLMEKPRIFLFGRTGSGKSSLANMLVRGNLDAPLLFTTSAGVRGETLCVQREESEDTVVVDTVGLGESEKGSVSNHEAQDILYNFFRQAEEGFHYFAFVRKWGRNDFLDEQLWKFFKQAFKGAEDNFVVIFTHFDKAQEEMQAPQTKELLLRLYNPCENWICVDFPDPGDQIGLSQASQRVADRNRARSLMRLKQKLLEFYRPAIAPNVCLQLRVGRVLLLGRRATFKAVLGNLLVKGNFFKSDPTQELPFSISPSSTTTSEAAFLFGRPGTQLPFEEGKGRRWEVVNLHAFESYISQNYVDHRELAFRLTDSILTTLMQVEGFSHVVYVHESRQGAPVRNEQDELIDGMFWRIILALLSAGIQEDRLVLVIANDMDAGQHSTMGLSSGKGRLAAEYARFKECKTLLHLDVPSLVHDDDAGPSKMVYADDEMELPIIYNIAGTTVEKRLDVTRRIFEQVLQKEVDTQSTFFKLAKLPWKEKQRLIAEVSEAYLTPVVKAMNKKSRNNRGLFRVRRSRTVVELSKAYTRLLNKAQSDITVRVQNMWEEQKSEDVQEEGQEDMWEKVEEEEEELEISGNNPDFCEVRQLVVIGQDADLRYLEMMCRKPDEVQSIEVTMISHDQGWSDFRADQGTYRNSWTWGELAVLASDGHTQIGERMHVYTNLHAVDTWQRHTKTFTEHSLLECMQADRHHSIIALYLRSRFAGWCNYTCYASIRFVRRTEVPAGGRKFNPLLDTQ